MDPHFLKFILLATIFMFGLTEFHNSLIIVTADVTSDSVNVEVLSVEKSLGDTGDQGTPVEKVDQSHHADAQTLNPKETQTTHEIEGLNVVKTGDGSVLADEHISKAGENSSQISSESTSGDNAKTNGTTKSGRPTKVTCLKRNDTENLDLTVQVMNSSVLPSSFQIVTNVTVSPCVLVLFYAPWCHFSAAAAPHFNALPRLFPDISCLAMNAAAFSSVNARYGAVALPTLLLFHNGQPVAKFNDTQYTLDNFAAFVTKYTSLEPVGVVNVTSADFEGPLPSIASEEADYLLWLSWIFLISCCCYGFARSTICHRIVEILRNNWQEAEAQHEHAE